MYDYLRREVKWAMSIQPRSNRPVSVVHVVLLPKWLRTASRRPLSVVSQASSAFAGKIIGSSPRRIRKLRLWRKSAHRFSRRRHGFTGRAPRRREIAASTASLVTAKATRYRAVPLNIVEMPASNVSFS